MSKIGQLELGYLPLGFPHFWGAATIYLNKYYPICIKLLKSERSYEIQVKFEYERNWSTGTGLSALGFLHFSHFRRVATKTWANIMRSVSNVGNKRSLRNTGRVWIWAKSVNRNWVICPFFNFPNFWGVATIILINIIGSVSNFKNRKVLRNTGQFRIWEK